MPKAYFISDAHIGADCKDREKTKLEKLLRFFSLVLQDGEKLFILGDFFDFWFEYRSVIHKEYFDILCGLRDLSKNSVEIHFWGGNHDWWARESLTEITGAKIHIKPWTGEIYGKKFFLAHGDGIAKCDWGYKLILKPLLRSPLSVFLFRFVHPDLAWKISRIASSSSRLYNEKRNLKLENEYQKFANKLLSRGVDFVVLGHIHIPQIMEFEHGIYILLGDFFRNFTYGVFDGSNFSILRI